MRIVAGSLKGRIFSEPHGNHTHPMSEKVRGALFNALGDIEGLSVLDAFAGSGALSLEAISRGASFAVAIERDPHVHKTLKHSIKELDLEDKVKAIRAGAGAWSDNNPAATFDIVMLAPPYDDLQPNLLQKLIIHLKDTGILVLDYPGKLGPPQFSGLKLALQKNYGDAQVVFYRKTG
jgi:16S rRNA (guanine966-N2)-methyltransferase